MLAEIITIGDELLIGQVVDTNSAWIARYLNENGIKVHQITSVSDDEQHIVKALNDSRSRVELVLITGGLGPTRDDITKKVLCRYFNTELVFSQEAYENLERIFKKFGREVTPRNRTQAEIPLACTPIMNHHGTAMGMWFEEEGKVFVSMPGVPHEMKGMMTKYILPKIKEHFVTPFIMHRTILTQGISESMLADKLTDFEDNLPADFKLAYLPSSGIVRLRLTASGNRKEISQKMEELVKLLEDVARPYIYGYDEQTLEKLVGELLREGGKTVCTAESCTGGYVAHMITSVPGSSEYYAGSTVTYSYQSKTSLLNVPRQTLERFGAVSEEVVTIMAREAKEKFNADYSIATTGIAGPGGGTADKPVGTVWVGIAGRSGIVAKKFLFGGERNRNIELTAVNALNMLRKKIIEEQQAS